MFPLRSICLNTETFLVEVFCPVHAVISEQGGLAVVSPLCWDRPFSLSHAIRDGPVSLASKVGRCGMLEIYMCARANIDTNSFAELLHCVQLLFRARGFSEGLQGCATRGCEVSV